MDLNDVIVESDTPEVERKLTGLFSLDLALSSRGELGLPARNLYELYGKNHVGKSTLAYYLTGVLAGTGEVDICDYDGLDPAYLKSAYGCANFKGVVHVISQIEKKKMRMHNVMAQELSERIMRKEVTCGILDSVTAYMPAGEEAGDIGEAFVGQRAKQIGQFVRRSVFGLKQKETPVWMFVINHPYAMIGGQGHTTAGGEVLKDLAGVRLSIYHKETLKNSNEDTLGYVVAGQVEKLRFGGKGRKFQYVIIPDIGLSQNLTLMFDCFNLGLAERSTYIKIDGKSVGQMSKLFEAAKEGKNEAFLPFKEKLERHTQEYFLRNGEVLE
jgi:RecA/RadA recombinase